MLASDPVISTGGLISLEQFYGAYKTPGSLISKEVPQILAPAECKYSPGS